MTGAKKGLSVPVLSVSADRVETADGRKTLTWYDVTDVPSSAVTVMVMGFVPNARVTAADAVPEVTVVPFTLMVALESDALGVRVMEVVALSTLTA